MSLSRALEAMVLMVTDPVSTDELAAALGAPSTEVEAELVSDVKQKPGRLFFKPGILSYKAGKLLVSPVDTAGSADLTAFSRANALLLIPADVSLIEAGGAVKVIVLEAFWKEGFENGSNAR